MFNRKIPSLGLSNHPSNVRQNFLLQELKHKINLNTLLFLSCRVLLNAGKNIETAVEGGEEKAKAH
jgi:hypothetical protein